MVPRPWSANEIFKGSESGGKLKKKVCLRRAPFPKKIKSIQLDANFVRNGEETIHTSFQCQQGKFICEADLDHLNVFSKQNGYR